jgi:hypothetical protein
MYSGIVKFELIINADSAQINAEMSYKPNSNELQIQNHNSVKVQQVFFYSAPNCGIQFLYYQ